MKRFLVTIEGSSWEDVLDLEMPRLHGLDFLRDGALPFLSLLGHMAYMAAWRGR